MLGIRDALAGSEVLVIGDRESDPAIGAALAPLGRELVHASLHGDSLASALDRDLALILLDARASERSGPEIARLVREDPRHAKTPIIVLAGAGLSSDAMVELCEAGVFDIVLGTLPPEALHAKARMHLELQERTHAPARTRARPHHDDDFFALLGHELRNPLNAMVCAIEVIKLRDRELGCEVEILDRQARHLERVITEVIDAGRMPERARSKRAQRCGAPRGR